MTNNLKRQLYRAGFISQGSRWICLGPKKERYFVREYSATSGDHLCTETSTDTEGYFVVGVEGKTRAKALRVTRETMIPLALKGVGFSQSL